MKMKIKILEYKRWQGSKVKVQSHNYRKGKWKENPQWKWHQRASWGVENRKEYEKIVTE